MTVEEVFHAHPDGGEGLLALVIRPGEGYPEGCRFVTPPGEGLQVGVMKRSAGHVVAAHRHPQRRREVRFTQEALVVRSGRVLATFYASGGEYAGEATVGAGDVLVLLAGAHGLVFLEESEVLECKLGPHDGADKVYLGGVVP